MKLKISKFTLIIIALLSFYNCTTEYKFTLNLDKKTTLGNTITAILKENNNNKIDKVTFYLDGKEVKNQGNSININTLDVGVGKHTLSAMVFIPGKTKKINNSFEVFAKNKPTLYDYKIVNTYPHDKQAYTQGLEFYDGYLYETTGRKGESNLRKVDLKTGKVLQQTNLDNQYFGEGMTIFNNKIYWLTWQAKKGFIYDVNTLKKEKEFKYNKSKEGWGLTHNAKELIKSDGSNKIWFLDPNTQKEKHYIQAYTNKVSLKSLNELELIKGKIYANYWQKPLIAIINPDNGVVEGIINLTGLVKEMEKTQKLTDQDDVLNGIAYDKENNRIFVTGKHWEKLFEIEILKK